MTIVNLNFNCEKCGACCKFVGFVVKQVQDHHKRGVDLPHPFNLFNDFPHEIKENGTCSMLDENNLCTIYKMRPAVCNVQTMYNIYYNMMGKEKYLEVSKEACQTLRNTIERIANNDGVVNSDM